MIKYMYMYMLKSRNPKLSKLSTKYKSQME